MKCLPGSRLWSLEEARWGGAPGLSLLTCAWSGCAAAGAAAIGTCRKGGRPDAGLTLPVRQGAPRWGCVETRERAARRQPTRHPGKLRPAASRGPPGSAARASGLLPRVLAARASGHKTLQPSRPRRCALRPSPAWPDTGSQVTVPGAGSPISRALIGPWHVAEARAGTPGRRGFRLSAGTAGGARLSPRQRQSVTARDAGKWSRRPSSCLFY